MRSFIAMGGGVGIGVLGVTHGLGPEPAKPPPPPPPPGSTATNADEREAIWERNRQAMRDWDAQRQFWHNQQQVHEKYERMRAEMEKASRAHAEQERLRAADVLYRYRAVDEPPPWLPPEHQQRWSTAGVPAGARQDVPESDLFAVQDSMESPVEGAIDVVEEVTAEAEDPRADYAIVPLGDHAAIEALADGTLEVLVDPVKGIRAVLEIDDGQRFLYGQIGSLPKRRVKAGETIGFTPSAAARSQAPFAQGAGAPPRPPMAGGPPPAGQLPPPRVARWPAPGPRVRQPVAVARAGGGGPPSNVVPLPVRPAPPPPPSRDRGVGVLLLLGLGAALLVGGKKGR